MPLAIQLQIEIPSLNIGEKNKFMTMLTSNRINYKIMYFG